MLGEFFKDKPRDSFVMVTKVKPGGLDHKTGLHGPESTEESFTEMFHTSLDRLQMDHVDILYNHIVSTREEGSRHGLGFIAMKNMAGGYHDEEKTQPVNGKAALKWALQNPNITTCIPGFTSFDQLDDDLEVMTDLELTEDEIGDLRLDDTQAGLFCIGCNVCRDQCKNRLPVPDLMRAYMYSYGYRNMEKARYVLDHYLEGSDPCSGCTSCTVKCTKGFRVDERIAYVSRLKEVPEDFIV